MIACFKQTVVASLTLLALSPAAFAAPMSAGSSTFRHHGEHWRGTHWRHASWRCQGAGCYRYGYGPFYPGYGYNRNNFCYEGESMYDGC